MMSLTNRRGPVSQRGAALPLLFALMLIGPGTWAAQPVATVTVNAQKPGAVIPRDFLGFSNEVSTAGMGLPSPSTQALGNVQRPTGVPANATLVYVLGEPGSPNADFFNFMRNLGPGILRQGGNSQDNTCWDAEAAAHPGWCQGAITPGLLKLYSEAARASGWRLILGLNLKQNSPSWTESEVADGFAKEIPSSEIWGLEVGNEPDLFARGPGRPKNYSSQDYVRDALGYIHAIRANPSTRNFSFVAPAACCGWRDARHLGIILDGMGKDLKLVSIHNYTTTTCGQKNVSAAELLSPERERQFDGLLGQLAAVARQHHLPIALAETNSASCGGMAGVSDAFASAVWGLDYMFSVARSGYTHINFHFSYRTGGSAYNPIQTFGWQAGGKMNYLNVAQPLYYAMYAFANNASGEHFLDASIKTNDNITAFATTECPHCAIHVFVINKDEAAGGKIDVQLTGAAADGSLLLVRAPSLGSLADAVRYGGQQFNSSGEIATPSAVNVARGTAGDYSFVLPNASAAVLTVTR